MTKKKRGHPDAEEILARPWCYYCERDFDDLKILISHQKAKHFKCDRCNRRLNTAGGLSVHLNQVHKETLTAVENALPNRSDLNVEIFGMEGIPEDIIQQHNQRVLQQFYEAEADRRASTGNPGPGGSGAGGQPKKPKVESADDLKARLAAFKAKKAAGETATTSSGNATPVGAGAGPAGAQSPGVNAHSPVPYQQQSGPQAFGQQPLQYPSHGSPPPAAFPQQFGQPYGVPPPGSGYGQSQAPFGSAPPGFPPHMQPFSPSVQQFPQFPQPGGIPFPPPQQFGPGSPPSMPFQPNRAQASSPQNGSVARPPSLPPAPGLPQRPSFAAPPVNAFQMQQFHHGHVLPTPNAGFANHPDPRRRSQDSAPGATEPQPASQAQSSEQQPSVTAEAVDDLIASVTGAQTQADPTHEAEDRLAESTQMEKQKKQKDKDKATRLVYSDNEFSPEEKMARMSRYAFNPEDVKQKTVLGDTEAAVSGVVDTVMDEQA